MKVAEALAQAAAAGLARLDAQVLLLQVLGRPLAERAWLIAHDTEALKPAAAERYLALCARRAAGEPVAYLVGHKEFFGLDFQVDPRVLVPRPDTEVLVDWSLEVLAALPQPRVIDLGTGSGAIAVAIARQRPEARVEAVDRSLAALAVARANAEALGATVQFREADWLQGAAGLYDLIASNPPYVAAADPHLQALVHEPLSALAAGPDGLDDLRRLAQEAPPFLVPGGWLLLEHGHDQGEAVRALLAAAGLAAVETRCDLAGIERCTGGRRLELG